MHFDISNKNFEQVIFYVYTSGKQVALGCVCVCVFLGVGVPLYLIITRHTLPQKELIKWPVCMWGGGPFFSYSKVTFSLNAHLEN